MTGGYKALVWLNCDCRTDANCALGQLNNVVTPDIHLEELVCISELEVVTSKLPVLVFHSFLCFAVGFQNF